MRILAIETSSRVGSVAALVGDGEQANVLREIALGQDQRTAQLLAPSIRALLDDAAWTPKSVELVTVAVGPGSFTGLRIGVTAAKTFAYAVGAEVIGVNTLSAIAAQAPATAAPLWTVMDAQRGELFAANFSSEERSELPSECAVTIVSQDAWLAQLLPNDFVTGPILRRLAPRLPEPVHAVDESLWQPTAASVGRIGWRAFHSGQRDDVWRLAPRYYRSSAAEEKARSK